MESEVVGEKVVKATDLGNFNIKTDTGNVFKATFKEVTELDAVDVNVIEIEGVKYSMDNVADFDSEFNKSKKNYKPNLFWSYYLDEIPTKCTINQVLGVPSENLGIVENFKEDLEGQTFKFKVKDQEYEVTFNQIGVVAEGFSSFYTLPKAEQEKDIMIIDIGGRTVNIVVFRKRRCVHRFQIDYGMINVYNDIKARYNNNGNNISPEDVLFYIEKKFIPNEIVQQAHYVLFDKIYKKVREFTELDLYKRYITGGGAIETEANLAKYDPEREFYLMDDPLFSNVNGNKAIARAKWGK